MEKKKRIKTEKKYEREQKYIHESYKWINIQFNLNKPEEMQLYDWVKQQQESQAQYIKSLIQKDMLAGKSFSKKG